MGALSSILWGHNHRSWNFGRERLVSCDDASWEDRRWHGDPSFLRYLIFATTTTTAYSMLSVRFFGSSLVLLIVHFTNALVLVRDLPTPCTIVDLSVLQRILCDDDVTNSKDTNAIPSLGYFDTIFRPHILDDDNCPTTNAPLVNFESINIMEEAVGLLYWHVKVQENANTDDHLCIRLDMNGDNSMVCINDFRLVLGINNHHVGSYYWARSAGSGASMEAPGIVYDNGILTWKNETAANSNSNDGKRSEWVAFLNPDDTVQLIPTSEKAMELLLHLPMYGITTQGRPLGSEPMVVCKWKEQQEI